MSSFDWAVKYERLSRSKYLASFLSFSSTRCRCLSSVMVARTVSARAYRQCSPDRSALTWTASSCTPSNRADMQFVDRRPAPRATFPGGVRPVEAAAVDELARPLGILWLKA